MGSTSAMILTQPALGPGVGWGGKVICAHAGNTNMPVIAIVPTAVLIRFNMILSFLLGDVYGRNAAYLAALCEPV